MSGTPSTPGTSKRGREEGEDLGDPSQRRVEPPGTIQDVSTVQDIPPAVRASVPFDPYRPDTWPQPIRAETLKDLLKKSKKLITDLTDDELTGCCLYTVGCLRRGDKEEAARVVAGNLIPPIVQYQNLANLKLFKQYHLICSTGTEATLSKRWPSIRDDQAYVPLVAFGDGFIQKVNLFRGDTGQGKTVAAVASTFNFTRYSSVGPACATFYCLANELVTPAVADVLAKCAKLREEAGECDIDEDSIWVPRHDRDRAVMAAIAEYVTRLLECKKSSHLLRPGSPIVLGLVVDEAGAYPDLVRALCAIGSAALYGVSKNMTARVAVAGAGIVLGDEPTGSLPRSYYLYHVTGYGDVWKLLTQRSPSNLHGLVEAINAHPRGRLAVRNSRYARLLCQSLIKSPDNVKLVTAAMPAVVDSLLITTARSFKSESALDTVPDCELLNLLGFSVLVSQRSAYEASSRFHEMVSRAMRQFGMVTETGSSRGPRYEVSVPTCGIILLLLGLVPRQSSLGGEALEEATATLMQVLVSTYGRTPDAFARILEAVGIPPNSSDGGANAKAGDMLVSDPRLKVNIVAVTYQKTGTGIDQVVAGSQEVAGNATEMTAYVVTNGPEYPLADVVVAVPGRALFLIQCMDGPLSAGMVDDELAKMGCPGMPDKVMKEICSRHGIHTDVVEERYRDAMALVAKLKEQFGVDDSKVAYLLMGSTMQKADDAALRGWSGRVEFAGMDSLASPFTDMMAFTPCGELPEETVAGVAQDASLAELLYKGVKNPPPTSRLLEEFGAGKTA